MWLLINRLRILIRDRANLFWALIFPLSLGTFFYLGFGNLIAEGPISQVNAYLASDYSDNQLLNVLETIKVDEEQNLFILHTEFTKAELEEKLHQNQITGYLFVDSGQIYYRINESGLSQTITKSVLDQYIQVSSLIVEVASTSPEKVEAVLNSLNNTKNYLEEIQNERQTSSNAMIIYFFALIAMTCTYGCFWGIKFVNDTQANQTSLAARITVAPTHKLRLVLINSLAAFIIHFIGCLLTFCYLNYILGVTFGDNVPMIILVLFVGSIAGIAFGAFLSSLIKAKAYQKEGIIGMITLALNALSGLMFPDLKYLIAKNVPVLGYINPSTLITDALHSLYYYQDLSHFYFYISILSGLTVLLLLGSYFFMRGSRYDSV